MNIARFFIDRPVFAAVLSIVITLLGGISLLGLPLERHPGIAPPTLVVSASYPGADSATVAETVATPLEQEINGVEDMLYMSSQSTNDGDLRITVTFGLGTDIDTAQVLVQNRVAIAEASLPEEVRRLGVTVRKSSPDLSLIINLVSPDGRYDVPYLSNYALINMRDRLARLPGVGDLVIFGARDYSMRVWLDPELMQARGLAVSDVVAAIRAQNVQVAAGTVGEPPTPERVEQQLTVRTEGRLEDAEAFADVIVRRGEGGALTRIRDIGRVELGALNQRSTLYLNGMPTIGVAIFQRPETNALETRAAVYAEVEKMAADFPDGLDYKFGFDTGTFIKESIYAVVKVFLEAAIVVMVVVMLFLQSWRATLIPMLAVPVSIVGTFAIMAALGFTLNTLSLMALVLAIGIVVDDAIVVVENVERNLADGLGRRDATIKAMDEVSSPIIATALVLSSVFVPAAFVPGLTGQFYREFAVAIAASTVISAISSLTLSPALAALFLKGPDEPPDRLQRLIDGTFGWVFRGFNRGFGVLRGGYSSLTRRLVRLGALVMLAYLGLLVATWAGFRAVPEGFLPPEDQGYIIVFVQLPDAASVERSDDTLQDIIGILRDTPGIGDAVAYAGFNGLARTTQSNIGTGFIRLEPFDWREPRGLTAERIANDLRGRLASVREAQVLVFLPPTVRGLGNVGGFKLELQDRAARGFEALMAVTGEFNAAANADPALVGVFSTFRADVPQLWLDIDRSQALQMGVPIENIFDTLQVYLGSLYVNDFNRFGRTYRVTAQAEGEFRDRAEDILRLKTRNSEGDMLPLGALADLSEVGGPPNVLRYNLYPAAEITGSPAPGVSMGEAMAAVDRVAERVLPPGFGFEWTDLSYQQQLAGNTGMLIFPLAVLFVFLALAAQYESWSTPFAVILIVPMCLLSSIIGLWIAGMENNILTQIGFIVLVGLASKNAILIVQFARVQQDRGMDRFEAAVESASVRFRPILMTSLSFAFGVMPLVLASGAGSESRAILGVAVMSGMLGVTVFGLLLTPTFYTLVRRLVERRSRPSAASAATPP